MAAAAIPAISLGAQHFLNRGANRRAQTALNSSTKGLQDTAGSLAGTGARLGQQAGSFLGGAQTAFRGAAPAYDAAAAYYAPLAAGSRGAMDQALAPDRAAITDTYRGAGKAIEASGMRGGTRDLANAELNRDRAGRLSLLAPAARANAAAALPAIGAGRTQLGAAQAGVGLGLSGQGIQAQTAAGGAQSNLFAGAHQTQALRYPGQQDANNAIGGMIFDALRSQGGRKGGSASTPGIAGPMPGVNFWSGVTAPRFG